MSWAVLASFSRSPRSRPTTLFLLGCTLGFSLSLSITGLALYARDGWKRRLRKEREKQIVEIRSDDIVDGVEGLIGNTPLVRIKSLSDLLGVEILGKCEFLNPFGSVKDRVSLAIVKRAEEQGLLSPHSGSCIFEGTSGSTGISIAGIARARGYKAYIVVPDDVAKEKIQLLEALGATVEKVRPVSIVDKNHYVNLARQRAAEFNASPPISVPLSEGVPPPAPAQGHFADQFENLANLSAHETGSGPEIYRQTAGRIDAFISGSGTGGTIAGVGRYLKGRLEEDCAGASVAIVLADPQGSGLFHKVIDGIMYSKTEEEGKRRRHQVDTVVEGIGLNRLTRNFSEGLPFIDNAYQVTDEEAVAMSRYLALHDGLFLGSSAAVNLVAAVMLAKEWGEEGRGKRIVTILCDSGSRHYSRFWNDAYLAEQGIAVSTTIDAILIN